MKNNNYFQENENYREDQYDTAKYSTNRITSNSTKASTYKSPDQGKSKKQISTGVSTQPGIYTNTTESSKSNKNVKMIKQYSTSNLGTSKIVSDSGSSYAENGNIFITLS